MSSSELVCLREGTTELLVPAGYNLRGPGSRTGEVFYNKQMEFGRDISVMFGRVKFAPGQKILDGLAAAGSRGLRLANECGVRAEFVLNDRNLAAAVLMKQNAELNSLGHVRIESRDLRTLLAEEQFDYIDIDPFGTPVDFIDSAVQSCRNGGVIAITATDTAPLYGTYPKTCLRRYGALSARSPFAHETGLRIILGYVVRQAGHHDRAALPILSYHVDHYFRCYIEIRNGAARADSLLKKLAFVRFDRKTLEREIVEDRNTAADAGPVWTGQMFSPSILNEMKATGDLGTQPRCEKNLGLWAEESQGPPLFYSMDELARKTKKSPPKLTEFQAFLEENDGLATRTHFDPKGIKTDLSARKVLRLYSKFPRTK